MTKNAWTDGDSVTATQLNRMEDQLVIICTSGTRPTGVEGQQIFETDTNRRLVYNGSGWRNLSSDWASYTPSWTNLTVGNGTVSASYCYVPGGIRCVGRFVYGSTSSISGNVTQTIPNSHTSVAPAVGGFVAIDATTEYTCSTQVFASNSAFLFYGQTANWAATNPFTPATSDEFIWDITIPI